MQIKQCHEWKLTPKEAIHLQTSLADRIEIIAAQKPIRYIAGADISYSKGDDSLFAAVVVMDYKTFEVLEIAFHIEKATFPYVTGLLAFREIPPLLKAFEKLKIVPDVVLCDGQGIAHPRRLGLAAHLGLWLNVPTIGCAKTRLIGNFEPLAIEKGCASALVYKNQTVGTVLRSKNKARPLFISPGHLIDIEGSINIVKNCLNGYRLPEPTRQAHLIVNRLRLGNLS